MTLAPLTSLGLVSHKPIYSRRANVVMQSRRALSSPKDRTTRNRSTVAAEGQYTACRAGVPRDRVAALQFCTVPRPAIAELRMTLPEGVSRPLEPTLLQHSRRDQLLLDMPLQNLDQKLPQIRALRLWPWFFGEEFNRSAEHLRCQAPAIRLKSQTTPGACRRGTSAHRPARGNRPGCHSDRGRRPRIR